MTAEDLTLAGALETLRELGAGLVPSPAGVERLLERAAASDTPEQLRAALVEVGARTLLDNWKERQTKKETST